MRKLICERCKKVFTCTGDEGDCWCFNIGFKFDVETNYNDCLCQKCLEETTNESSEDSNQG